MEEKHSKSFLAHLVKATMCYGDQQKPERTVREKEREREKRREGDRVREELCCMGDGHSLSARVFNS